MKFLKKICFVLVLLLLSKLNFAQKNVFKFHTVPYAWGEFRVGYERVIFKAVSLQFNYGTFLANRLPSYIYNASLVEDYQNTMSLTNKLSGYSTSLDVRVYLGLNAPKKFYIAPYIKHNKYSFLTSSSYDYKADLAEYYDLTPAQQSVGSLYANEYFYEVTGTLDGTVVQYGGGVSIGMQFVVAKIFAVDLNFFGLGVEYNDVNADLTTNIDVDYDRWLPYVTDEVREIKYIGDKVELSAEKDRIKMHAPIVLPTFRGSIAIGFAF